MANTILLLNKEYKRKKKERKGRIRLIHFERGRKKIRK